MKRVIAYSTSILVFAAAVQYGHADDRSGVAVIIAVLAALVVLEIAVRIRPR
ncbi:hypothetical protein [Nocardia arizonensis]|uniref:hypothetical protein n=1 Tax=Nocardia arizonensis TaxID=1141647 RepID=UPI000B16E9D0|nr:hypothetical protein [Nocardia arizonensis]